MKLRINLRNSLTGVQNNHICLFKGLHCKYLDFVVKNACYTNLQIFYQFANISYCRTIQIALHNLFGLERRVLMLRPIMNTILLRCIVFTSYKINVAKETLSLDIIFFVPRAISFNSYIPTTVLWIWLIIVLLLKLLSPTKKALLISHKTQRKAFYLYHIQ